MMPETWTLVPDLRAVELVTQGDQVKWHAVERLVKRTLEHHHYAPHEHWLVIVAANRLSQLVALPGVVTYHLIPTSVYFNGREYVLGSPR